MAEARKKPLGEALVWSDDDLERLAEIADRDVLDAVAWWRAHAVDPWTDLIDALEDLDAEPGS